METKSVEESVAKEEMTSTHLVPHEKLVVLKKLRGLSFNKIAKGCGISKTQVIRILQGTYFPNPEVKQRLAEFFEVNAFELWEGEK